MSRMYPFEAIPFSFSISCLEPAICADVTEEHYLGHYMHYLNGLNDTLAAYPTYQSWSLTKLAAYHCALPLALRASIANYAGGVYNHELYWHNFQEYCCQLPKAVGKLALAIEDYFGSFSNFMCQFTETAQKMSAPGWVWLVVENRTGKLTIESTTEQAAPLSKRFSPILALDLWEHAYYEQYQSDKACYIENWWHLLNWDSIDKLFGQATNPQDCEGLFTLACLPQHKQKQTCINPKDCSTNGEAVATGESYYTSKHQNICANSCGNNSHGSTPYYNSKSCNCRKKQK